LSVGAPKAVEELLPELAQCVAVCEKSGAATPGPYVNAVATAVFCVGDALFLEGQFDQVCQSLRPCVQHSTCVQHMCPCSMPGCMAGCANIFLLWQAVWRPF
jgi:hypothetical protein